MLFSKDDMEQGRKRLSWHRKTERIHRKHRKSIEKQRGFIESIGNP
jgi:hypothetical protein